jgi:hypothetical protein
MLLFMCYTGSSRLALRHQTRWNYTKPVVNHYYRPGLNKGEYSLVQGSPKHCFLRWTYRSIHEAVLVIASGCDLSFPFKMTDFKKLATLSYKYYVQWITYGNVHRLIFSVKPFVKGIVQRILSGVDTMLKLSVLVNWKPARFSVWILKGHHHKRSIKPFLAA